jgi:hypothetical protein
MRRLLLCIILTLAAILPASAADLTAPQMATLKQLVQSDPTAAGYAAVGDDIALAAWLNASTATVVWRTEVSVDSIMRNGMDWARVDNLSVGKARIWDWMGRLGQLDCSRPSIRAGIDATWVGTAADLAVRATVYTHCKRPATRAESALATGTGSDASPSVMGWEGTIDYALASTIRS